MAPEFFVWPGRMNPALTCLDQLPLILPWAMGWNGPKNETLTLTPALSRLRLERLPCLPAAYHSFYFSKLPEFIDTIIMLLKRNYRQVSFLHVYHHSSIFLIWWLVTFLAPTGEAWYSAMLNSFIHVIMYGYYFTAAIGWRGVEFVKRYITMMQMTQFVTMMIQVSFGS